jgi:hypothetical protein
MLHIPPPWGMPLNRFSVIARPLRVALPALAVIAIGAAPAHAQRQAARPVSAVQAFAVSDCRTDCVADTLLIDVERGRRAQPGVVTATIVLIDTVAQQRRGGPAAPKERPVPVWFACDDVPCGAAVLIGKITDRRIDDTHVARRTAAAWTLPSPLLLQLSRGSGQMMIEGRTHPLTAAMTASVRALVEGAKVASANTTYSPRAQLYVATFALFGIPGDSAQAEDVGTATEPLMIPDATTTTPTRVATLTVAGHGNNAVPMLVQDDATGAAPIFGVGEAVSIALPGRTGRRGVVTAKVLARQRVDVLRDACDGMKVWTYLMALSPADLATVQRGRLAATRTDDTIDRWNGVAVRDVFPARQTAVEQRAIAGSRAVVAQFVRERAASGVRERDVQVLASLPRAAGFVTNFGVFARDQGGNWRFPTLSLRPAACP